MGTIGSAPYGNASLLPITFAYLLGLGPLGLRKATAVAVLNANYMVYRLKPYYKVLFGDKNGRVGHEFVLDIRPLTEKTGITVEDVGKRLIDFSC